MLYKFANLEFARIITAIFITLRASMQHVKVAQLNFGRMLEDSRQSLESFALHDCSVTEQQRQQGGPNELCRIALG